MLLFPSKTRLLMSMRCEKAYTLRVSEKVLEWCSGSSCTNSYALHQNYQHAFVLAGQNGVFPQHKRPCVLLNRCSATYLSVRPRVAARRRC